jgi:hypothetical protein
MNKTTTNNWKDNLEIAVEYINKRNNNSGAMLVSSKYHIAKTELELDVIFELMAEIISNKSGIKLFTEDQFSFVIAVNKEYNIRTGKHGMAIGTISEAIEDAMIILYNEITGHSGKGLEDDELMEAIKEHCSHYLYEALKVFIINVNEMNKNK